MTQLHNVLYVVCAKSSIIKTYTADTLSSLADIHVEGMREPRDIVVCRHDRQLYVAECYCIWRVSVDDQSYVKWLTTQSSTDTFHVYTLSMTSRRLLVTSQVSAVLRQYSTVDGQLLRVVELPRYMKVPQSAAETTSQTFVVCHRCISQTDWRYAVSELFRFCQSLHTFIHQSNPQIQLNWFVNCRIAHISTDRKIRPTILVTSFSEAAEA